MTDDFFADLDAQIEEATKALRLKADAAKLKKKAQNTRLSSKERAEAAAEFRSIQAIVEANDWQVVRCAAVFSHQTCDGCGSEHFTFLQFMQEEEFVRNRSTSRWVRAALPIEGLPRDTIIQPLTTHMCADCCEEHGFHVKTPEIKLMPIEGAVTVSATYEQGDINGPTT